MPFTKRALGFFRGLARHNEKPWFEAHRDEYETEVRKPMRDLIEDLDTSFAEFAPEIGGDPKRAMPHLPRHSILRTSRTKTTRPAGSTIERSSHGRRRGGSRSAGYFHFNRAGDPHLALL
jgi:uncharacterized protein (DUF2461 family)